MINLCRTVSSMAKAGQKVGLQLKDIITGLQNFAPCTLAESWDNVGLLINPMTETPVHTAMLTNDLTEDVVEEAIKAEAGLIISYHPNIFRPLKSVSERTWKERIVVQCIKNNIAVYSPHTSWDAIKGGVNDWLAGAFQHETCQPINPNPDDPTVGSGRLLILSTPIAVGIAVEKIKGHIGINHLRLALGKQKDQASLVSTVALGAGSGSSVLSGVDADLYLTGEMLHHDILDATQKGIHVILCNHSDSERGFLKVFQNHLQQTILGDKVNVLISQNDHDPLVTV